MGSLSSQSNERPNPKDKFRTTESNRQRSDEYTGYNALLP